MGIQVSVVGISSGWAVLSLNWHGRTKIQLFSDAGDDTDFTFFLVDEFHIYLKTSCDVATFALRFFLQDEHAKMNLDPILWIDS